MAVRGIDHIELVIRDVARHVKFFEAMGFKVILKSPHHGGSAEVQLPAKTEDGKPNGEYRTIIELHSIEGEENPGINHVAFSCDSVDGTYEEMKKKGIKFEKAPFDVKATGRRISNFRDPDGWRVQLVDLKRSADVFEDKESGGAMRAEADIWRDKPDILN
jgi:catechol 2,3-dioxygenase-like lactoylglutathione lyase family enzyme